MVEEFVRFAEEGHIMIVSRHGNGSNGLSSGTGSSRRSGAHSPARAWAVIALSAAVMAGSLCACGSTSGTDASPSASASSPVASQSPFFTALAFLPSTSASAFSFVAVTGACTTKELIAKLT